MSYWFLPKVLSSEAAESALKNHELAIPAEGLPDLAKAQGPDQIAEWLKRFYPEATPEHIAGLAEHYWRLGHELMVEDTVVLPVDDNRAYIIGEVEGVYRLENRAKDAAHVWPVRWHGQLVAAVSLPAFASYAASPGLTEVNDEDALKSLEDYVPALRKPHATFFRWLAITILISELIYFWPRGD